MVGTDGETVRANILHGAPVAMALLEGPAHVFRDVNDAFCHLVGKERDALLGQPFAAAVSPDEEALECIALLDRVHQTGAPGTLSNEQHDRTAGRDPAFWSYSAWAVPTAPASGEAGLTGVVVQVTDTTEDHTFREMASRMNHELIVTTVRLSEQTDTMAEAEKAKDEFLAMLAHEIRNPLSAISNAATLLEMRTIDQQNVQRPVQIILRQVKHTARLVEDLMDVSRITLGKLELRRERLDLSAAANRAAELAQPLMANAGCMFSVSKPLKAIWLNGDIARIEQILGNLLNNAAKYTDQNGRVILALRVEGDEAVIEVKDTGVGIAPELLPRVFDLFVQEDRSLGRSQGGLGIGLSLVKTLAELHGGTAHVESPGIGRGSVFTVRLPAAQELDIDMESAGRSSDATSRPLRVLLVEDNVLAALPLADILELWGHQVRVVHDGPAAIAAMRTEVSEVVLLDLGLPGMDGYEVARTMRCTPGQEHIRIVALTGYGSEADRRLTRDSGFDEHLVKPVDMSALQSVLTRYGWKYQEDR